MPHTPRSDSATTRKPDTAPPRSATVSACETPVRAAAATRTLERTATHMPMMPDSADRQAPMRKEMATYRPICNGEMPSASGKWSKAPMITPSTTDVMTASTMIVLYCRRMKATAPS
jgi:hypothetical protein